MKSTVKFVNVYDESIGRVKTIEISDDYGNLKYELLVHLFEAGVLVPDEFSTKAFREILKNRQLLKKQVDTLIDENDKFSIYCLEELSRRTKMLDELTEQIAGIVNKTKSDE